MAWGESKAWMRGTASGNLYQALLDDALNQPARALVLKTKPMYMFLNMLFQHLVEPRPTEPAPGGKGFEAREAEVDYNHAK